MCGTKGIIYEYFTKACKLFTEFFSVLCFLCTIPCIFQKNHITVIHCRNCSFRIFADNIGIGSNNGNNNTGNGCHNGSENGNNDSNNG